MASATTSLPASVPAQSNRPTVPVSLVAAAVLIVGAFTPLLAAHFAQLWGRPHYQFFPMVFVGVAVLTWSRWPGFASLEPGAPRIGAGLLAWSWLLLAAAELTDSSWLGAVAAMFLPLALLFALGGRALAWQLLPAWILLGLIIPPPAGLDNSLVLALQSLTTRWSSALLDHCGIFHMMAGNVVEIAGRRFFVDEACTGINSLFSVLACALFYVFFARIPVIRALLLIGAAIAWVLMANTTRVFLVVYLAKRWGVDVAEGWRHDALGFLLFGAALILIWSTDRLLVFLSQSRKRQVVAAPPGADSGPRTGSDVGPAIALSRLGKSWAGTWVAVAAFGCLIYFHFTFNSLPSLSAAESGSAVIGRVTEETLPKNLSSWIREKAGDEWRNPGSAYGEFSKMWWYRADGAMPIFSLDYPFASYHELTFCYQNQGWRLEVRNDYVGVDEGQPSNYCEGIFKKSGKRSGYLLFCEFDQTGRVMQLARSGIISTLKRREAAFKRNLAWLDQSPAQMPPVQVGTLFQFQLFVETNSPLPADEVEKTKMRFFEAFHSLQRDLISGKGANRN